MHIKDWGEDPFIEYISKQFPSRGNLIGIGDDSAVIPKENGSAWLITTDALVEGVHFLRDQIAAKDLGYKTVAVNVSDIVAMGGAPQYAFLSIALPKNMDCSWAQLVIDGIREACIKWDILLLGGDTVGSQRDIFINLTLIGSALQSKIKYRNQAQSGDVICVSEYLGDSAGGLKALQTGVVKTVEIQRLIDIHFRPEPIPEQGMWLASHHEVHAMMDISDGLVCDLRRLLKSSQKGAIIEIDQVPISSTLSKVSREQSWDALELALVGGEDYCLLLTVAPQAFESLQNAFQAQFQRPLLAIGHINDCEGELNYTRNNESIQVTYKNYNHF
jgi:thiamine-monophosphate kinase